MYLNNVTSTGFANSETQARTTREATIIQHLAHVNALAKRLRSQVPPCVTLDDLIGAGTIGLIQAVDRFQPSRGLQFATYAKHRIRGAMLDFLREEDPLAGPERRAAPPKEPCPRQSAWNSFRRMNRGANTQQPVASQLVSRIEWTWAAPGNAFRRERTGAFLCCSISTGRTVTLPGSSGQRKPCLSDQARRTFQTPRAPP
jgi:RNA polymerase sigma factor (sigma-70 family)